MYSSPDDRRCSSTVRFARVSGSSVSIAGIRDVDEVRDACVASRLDKRELAVAVDGGDRLGAELRDRGHARDDGRRTGARAGEGGGITQLAADDLCPELLEPPDAPRVYPARLRRRLARLRPVKPDEWDWSRPVVDHLDLHVRDSDVGNPG